MSQDQSQDHGNGVAVVSSLYAHEPHPRTEERQNGFEGPVSFFDQYLNHTKINKFNSWLAVKVTNAVGTMWCAYAFAAFDVLALPYSIHQGLYGMVQWVASFFLQLVLLSVIMVGQNVQANAAEKRALQTYHDADATLHEAVEIQKHLAAQDEVLTEQNQVLSHQNVILADLISRLERIEGAR